MPIKRGSNLGLNDFSNYNETVTKKLIDEFGERVADIAVEKLNEVIRDVEKQAIENLHKHGIKGTRMYEGFKHKFATRDKEDAWLSVEVWSDNPIMEIGTLWNSGVYDSEGYANVGRIIEFSERINKPFFYDAFYQRRKGLEKEIRAKVAEVIKDANRKSQ